MKELNLTAKDWQKTFDSIADLIFIQDIDFTIIKANKAFLEAIGARQEDVIGKKCYEILHSSDKPWPTCPFDMTKEDSSENESNEDLEETKEAPLREKFFDRYMPYRAQKKRL